MTIFKTGISRRFAMGGLAASFCGLMTLSAIAEPVTIRIASVNPPTTESVVIVQEVADAVTQRTDGRVKFQLFPSGQLGTTTDSLEQASQGQPIITFVSASFMAAAR